MPLANRVNLMGIDDILKIIFFLLGFCALLFLAYVTARYIGQKQMRTMQGKNISVVETVMLGGDKRLHLVRAGNSYVLIATTSKSVEFLTNVEMDETAAREPDIADKEMRFDFRSILEKYGGIYRPKREEASAEPASEDADKQNDNRFRSNLDKIRKLVNKDNHTKLNENGDDDYK